ncbi:tetratricopeptide repeat protein [Pseudocolwellia agarivorans]|uniref:tetratricopeptide repeat protein n=1 Tax=Pseudocolwellia agarivorans TaxID=1911682 RepID=UPI0009858F36|nr:tetratricopeptide repeat protein [Pseudocolwellia agarivorans]
MKRHSISFNAIFLSLLLLSGCESITNAYQQNIKNPNKLYLDQAYPEAINFQIETEEELFAIDEEMENMVKHVLKPERDHEKRARLLLEYIFSSNHIAMSYENDANVTAIDAFHGKKANCMSLTIMAYALATKAGMKLKFQDIQVPEYWMRKGTHQLLMGHVNLLINKPSYRFGDQVWSKEILQIDFDPGAAKSHFDRKIVSKKTIVAMFYNNKGAEALVRSEYDLAYAYFKAATQVDPLFYSGWGNLGVLYKMNHHYDLAVNAYKYALSLSPDDLTSLENLALLFKRLDRKHEALNIQNKLHTKRLNNPHYHALLSNEANYNGDHLSAITHLKKAIRLESRFHEFYYNLAKLYLKTEQYDLAKSSMKKALKYNKNIHTEREYNRKLNFLNQASIRY